MSENVEVLRAARAVIEDPAKWTTGWYARNGDGDHCPAEDKAAVCWCAFGAMRRVADRRHEANDVLIDAARELFKDDVDDVNDKFGHEAVLRMYDRAIELAEAAS